MEQKPKHQGTHLFAIRVWAEKPEQGTVEWRGKVQNVGNGKGYYFCGWQALVELLQTLVSQNNDEEP